MTDDRPLLTQIEEGLRQVAPAPPTGPDARVDPPAVGPFAPTPTASPHPDLVGPVAEVLRSLGSTPQQPGSLGAAILAKFKQ